MTFDEAIGHTVRATRELQHVSMRELAESLGVTTSALSRLENGKTQLNIVKLRKIARRLKTEGSTIVERAEKLWGAYR